MWGSAVNVNALAHKTRPNAGRRHQRLQARDPTWGKRRYLGPDAALVKPQHSEALTLGGHSIPGRPLRLRHERWWDVSRPGTNAAFAPRLEGPGDPGLSTRRRVPGRPTSGLAAVGGDRVPLGVDLRACHLPSASASASGQRHSIEAQRPAMAITLTHSLGERHPDRLLPYGQADTQLVLTLQHCDSCWWHVLNCGIALQLQVMESRPVQCSCSPAVVVLAGTSSSALLDVHTCTLVHLTRCQQPHAGVCCWPRGSTMWLWRRGIVSQRWNAGFRLSLRESGLSLCPSVQRSDNGPHRRIRVDWVG